MSNMEQLRCEDKRAIEEIRMRMKNDLPKNMSENAPLLYRFLKARDFDVDKAEKMLRKNIAWRKAFQVDTILQHFRPKECFHKYLKMSHIGFDKDGDMVKYSPSGKTDGKNVLKCIKMNDYMKHWVWYSEEIRAYWRQLRGETGQESEHIRIIVDLDKLTIGNATSTQSAEIFIRLLSMLQDNYPECLKSFHVINAPSYYVFIYSIMKAMMSNAMIRKIHVYGYSGWKEKLLEIIDADVLPAFLGGNRTDPDGNPLCTTFINHCGKIPEMYYLSKAERYFKDNSKVHQVVVPHRGKKEISVDVTECGSVIEWQFLVKSKDIGFGLFYKLTDEERKEILPVLRYDTFDGTEEGYYKSQSTGKYVFVFDNSFSWLSSKEVEYCISVVKCII